MSWIAMSRHMPLRFVIALLSRYRIALWGGVPAWVSPRASYAITVAQKLHFTFEPLTRSTHLDRTSFAPGGSGSEART